MNAIMTQIGNGVTQVIGWTGEVVQALVGENGALADLMPLVALGIGVSAVLLGIKVVRNMIWGA